MNLRRFIGGLAATVAAASLKPPLSLHAHYHRDESGLKITSVEAFPVKLWDRSGQSSLPEFKSDFDPNRWRYRGKFSQLASAIIVVIKTNQGITGYGFGVGGSVARVSIGPLNFSKTCGKRSVMIVPS